MSTKTNPKAVLPIPLRPLQALLKSLILNHKSTKAFGFTLVEVAVVMPLVILVIGILVGAIMAMVGNVLVTRADNSLIFNIQEALTKIESDVETSGAYLATNNFAVQSPQGVNDNTDKFTSTAGYLVLNAYATTGNPASADRTLVYEEAAGTCDETNGILMYNIVYFVKAGSLWRRTVMPNNYNATGTNCSKPWQKPSCSTEKMSEPFCKSKDSKLVNGVTEFNVKYYNSADTELTAANLASSTYIKIEIKAKGSAAGRTFTESGSIRAISPNNNALP